MPEIDLSKFFLHETPTRTLVVEHATGIPKFVVGPDDTLTPYEPDPIRGSLTVVNPPDFKGFPEHDRSDPAFDPATHGMADTHFVHWETDRPTLVRHSTGRPEFLIDEGGKAVPL